MHLEFYPGRHLLAAIENGKVIARYEAYEGPPSNMPEEPDVRHCSSPPVPNTDLAFVGHQVGHAASRHAG